MSAPSNTNSAAKPDPVAYQPKHIPCATPYSLNKSQRPQDNRYLLHRNPHCNWVAMRKAQKALKDAQEAVSIFQTPVVTCNEALGFDINSTPPPSDKPAPDPSPLKLPNLDDTFIRRSKKPRLEPKLGFTVDIEGHAFISNAATDLFATRVAAKVIASLTEKEQFDSDLNKL